MCCSPLGGKFIQIIAAAGGLEDTVFYFTHLLLRQLARVMLPAALFPNLHNSGIMIKIQCFGSLQCLKLALVKDGVPQWIFITLWHHIDKLNQ